MNTVPRMGLPVYVCILLIAGSLLIPSFSDSAHAQCALSICKSAPEIVVPFDDEDLVFNFSSTQGDFSTLFDLTANSECFFEAFSGSDLEIVEEPKPGWILDDVVCSDSALVSVTPIENGVSLDCLGGTEISCSFINVRGSETNIPTLSEWGMIAVAGGLGLVGVFFAMRRKRMIQDA